LFANARHSSPLPLAELLNLVTILPNVEFSSKSHQGSRKMQAKTERTRFLYPKLDGGQSQVEDNQNK
jgi:hypothetical protein